MQESVKAIDRRQRLLLYFYAHMRTVDRVRLALVTISRSYEDTYLYYLFFTYFIKKIASLILRRLQLLYYTVLFLTFYLLVKGKIKCISNIGELFVPRI